MHVAIHVGGIVALLLAGLCVLLAFGLDWRGGNRGWFWQDIGEGWMTAALVLMLVGVVLVGR